MPGLAWLVLLVILQRAQSFDNPFKRSPEELIQMGMRGGEGVAMYSDEEGFEVDGVTKSVSCMHCLNVISHLTGAVDDVSNEKEFDYFVRQELCDDMGGWYDEGTVDFCRTHVQKWPSFYAFRGHSNFAQMICTNIHHFCKGGQGASINSIANAKVFEMERGLYDCLIHHYHQTQTSPTTTTDRLSDACTRAVANRLAEEERVSKFNGEVQRCVDAERRSPLRPPRGQCAFRLTQACTFLPVIIVTLVETDPARS